MFATFNLQLTATTTFDAASETPAAMPVSGPEAVNLEGTDFARLLHFEADSSTPRGDFVPPGGNTLPQIESVPVTDEELPAIDIATSLIVGAELESLVAVPALTPAGPLADSPLDEIVTSIPEVRQALQNSAAATQAGMKPGALVVTQAVPETTVAEAVRQQIPLETGQIAPTVAAASPLRELAQSDRREIVMPRSERPAVATNVAVVAGTTVSPEADVVPRVTAMPEATVVPDRGAPAIAAVAANPVSGTAPRDPGLLPQATTDLVRTPVTDPTWGERIGQRVVMMAGNQLQQAEIRLTPAELGPVRIQIAVEDGAANVTFLAQHAVTREAIEAAMPRLREMLADSGLSLGQANVGGDGVAEGQRDRREASNAAPSGEANAERMEETLPERQKTVTSDGLIDTFA